MKKNEGDFISEKLNIENLFIGLNVK